MLSKGIFQAEMREIMGYDLFLKEGHLDGVEGRF